MMKFRSQPASALSCVVFLSGLWVASSLALARTGSTEARLEWESVRGLFYTVERGLDGQPWTPVGPAFQATEPLSEWTDTAATGDRPFYRVRQEPAP